MVIQVVLWVVVVVVAVVLIYKGVDFSGDPELKEGGGMALLKAVLIVILGLVFIPSMGTINTGHRGVVLRLGAMTGRILDQGLYFVVPIVDKVKVMSVQVEAYPTEAAAASKDMQTVHTKITLNYQLESKRVGEIYRDMGYEFHERVIVPAIQESVKAATAQFDAESLIGRREEVRMKIKSLLTGKLEGTYGIRVCDVSITDFNFSEEFNKAIEAKATANQNAAKALRDLMRIKTEAQQKIAQAQAEAESLRIQKGNVTSQMIMLRQIEVQKIMAEKWNGQYPVVMAGGNTGLLLQVPGLASPNLGAGSAPQPVPSGE